MQALRLLHHVAIIAWFGSAAVDVLLELVLSRAPGAERQRALIDLHKLVDLVLEGPGILLTLGSGVGMLWLGGHLAPERSWPSWLVWMVVCGSLAAAANLICVLFVVARARAASTTGATAPLEEPQVRRWHRRVAATGVGIPFALIALWFGVMR